MQTLEYHDRPTGSRYPKRALILTVTLIGFVLAARFAYPRLRYKMSSWLLEREAMSFLDHQGTIVYDEDPVMIDRLMKQGGYEKMPYAGTIAGTDWDPVRRNMPGRLMYLEHTAVVCFCHQLTGSDGERHIVEVHMWNQNREATGDGRVVSFYAGCLDDRDGEHGGHFEIPDLEPGDRLRVFGGQLDPTDPSLFSIEFQVNGKPEILHGRLGEGFDVHLTSESKFN